ncbi:MAG: hydroxymethylglutaryl-CoA lyase [Rhodocyclaceae bacterium]|nr:hydroxymethylglutaryl-CoA lyase [Rhodocyclaceae bacterium]
MPLPTKIRIVEVGPRDGLQNEEKKLPTAVKLALIERLADCGLTIIEATAFVSPKWSPQMADAAEVMAGLPRKEGVSFPVLVPNEKGLDAALAAGAKEIAVFAAASETFSQKNINCSIRESLERFRPVIQRARDAGMKVRGYVSCVLGCPFEGEIAPLAVAEIAWALFEMGCYEISLGDTVGFGTPEKTKALIEAVGRRVPIKKLAGHFHDTYGMAIANIYAALQEGVNVFDASVAGLGGCPHAPGAAGNVATEEVVWLAQGLGIDCGIELSKLVDTAAWISGELGRSPASKVARAILAQRRRG